MRAALQDCLLGKGERQGVRVDLEVSVWFSSSRKGCKGHGLGRERAWKKVTGERFGEILEILRVYESDRGQTGGLHIVGRNQGLGRVCKIL